MKKLLFGIFAHPDDEAFGPCATLVQEVQTGTELHLISFTCGQAGANPDSHPDLGAVRLDEWRMAAKLIGATGTHHLGYHDGHLDNEQMIAAQERIATIIRDILEQHKEPVQVEIMTFDPNGISGHIDHIVAARAASWVYYTLKGESLPMKRLRYFCVPNSIYPDIEHSWLFMERGRSEQEISEVIDAREHFDTVNQVMRTHHTQRSDAESHLKSQGKNVAINHFMIRE